MIKQFDITTALLRKNVPMELIEEMEAAKTNLKIAKNNYETLQAKQNRLTKEFGKLKSQGLSVDTIKAEVDNNKILLKELTDIQNIAETILDTITMRIPNTPDADVPDGVDENDNIEIKKVLIPPLFAFTPKEHWELAEANGWIDFEKGVKLAKSRFSVVLGMGARLERALINFMLDFNRERGFQEVSVPVLVNRRALEGTGQLPKFEDDLFKVEYEELYLIPTAEVPIANLFQDEIIPVNELPIKMCGHTPCFRKEAGSGGRDVRGMIRQHQFHKVELVAITTAEQSDIVFDEMVNCASDLLTALGLPHRLVTLCAGDLGFSAAKTIDIEVWLPSQNSYREISSISNTREFQARRAKIRYKENGKNIPAHTLNGSSLAVGRTMVAIMENFQQEDGTIIIPEVLKKYL